MGYLHLNLGTDPWHHRLFPETWSDLHWAELSAFLQNGLGIHHMVLTLTTLDQRPQFRRTAASRASEGPRQPRSGGR